MARRSAFLCIGLPDALGTGTTADLLDRQADALAVAGYRLPASAEATRRAAWEVTRDHRALAAAGLSLADVEGTWEGIWRRAYRSRPRDVVLAEDGLVRVGYRQVELVLDALAGFTVHLVVLAADPADMLARAWADAVRHDRPMPLLRFRDRLERDGQGHEQARHWWAAHHLPEVLARWSAHVPHERVHVVVVSGEARHRAQQAGTALGSLLGAVALDRALGTPDGPVDGLAPAPAVARLPSTVLDAMRSEAAGWADLLHGSSYDLHGNPDALVPALPGRAMPAGSETTTAGFRRESGRSRLVHKQ